MEVKSVDTKILEAAVVGNDNRHKDFFTAAEVAKSIGVSRQAVEKWRKKNSFAEDFIDSNGVYWYSKERVENFKSTYRKGGLKFYRQDTDAVYDVENLTFNQKQEVASALCDAMDYKNLSFDDWFPITTALKNLGFSAEEVLQMNSDSPKFNAAEVRSQYNAAGGNFDLITIMGKAKQFAPAFDYKAFWASFDFEGINYQEKPQPALKTAVNAPEVATPALIEESTEQSKKEEKEEKEELIRADLKLPDNLGVLGKFRSILPAFLKTRGCVYVENWLPIWARLKGYNATLTPRLLFPAGNHYLARLTVPIDTFSGAEDFKYIKEKPHEGTKHLFGAQAINSKTKYVVISEGEIDAVSIEQALDTCYEEESKAIASVATCSAISGGKIGEEIVACLKNLEELPKVIILFDNDDTGRTQSAKLREFLVGNGILTACEFLPARDDGSKRDANDILVEGDDCEINGTAGELELSRLVISAITNAEQDFESARLEIEKRLKAEKQELFGLTPSEYLAAKFPSILEERKKFADRRTGFENLDAEIGAFVPAIYIIAGAPGVGKTSFALQLACQVAENDNPVFYVSLEIGEPELYSKLLARKVYIAEGLPRDEKPLTANNILRSKFFEHAEIFNEVSEELKSENLPLYIWELDGTAGLDSILGRLESICAKTEKPPVVFIDYFQLLAGGNDNIKSELDKALIRLKKFQRQNNVTFVLLSSVNRGAYYSEFALESLKETGGIEYTADVIWGLQYCLGEETVRSYAEISKAQQEFPRHIQLKCIKNRFGGYYDIAFWYFSAMELFTADNEYGGYTEYQKDAAGNLSAVQKKEANGVS